MTEKKYDFELKLNRIGAIRQFIGVGIGIFIAVIIIASFLVPPAFFITIPCSLTLGLFAGLFLNKTVKCPSCDNLIFISAEHKKLHHCKHCHENIKITWINPTPFGVKKHKQYTYVALILITVLIVMRFV